MTKISKSEKRHLNSLKGNDNRIKFLQKLISEKNEQIKYLSWEIKKLKEDR